MLAAATYFSIDARSRASSLHERLCLHVLSGRSFRNCATARATPWCVRRAEAHFSPAHGLTTHSQTEPTARDCFEHASLMPSIRPTLCKCPWCNALHGNLNAAALSAAAFITCSSNEPSATVSLRCHSFSISRARACRIRASSCAGSACTPWKRQHGRTAIFRTASLNALAT